jgi:hypothetical protein
MSDSPVSKFGKQVRFRVNLRISWHLVGTDTIDGFGHVAIGAKDLESRWVAMRPEPSEQDGASLTNLSSMIGPIVVDVVDLEKFGLTFPAAGALPSVPGKDLSF